MEWIYNDGGRKDAGYKGDAGDCVVRAIAIVTGKPYQEVYDAMFEYNRKYKKSYRRKWNELVMRMGKVKPPRVGDSPRNGVGREVFGRYLEERGYKWVPTMKIGQGTKVHLREDELPAGRLVVRVSKHVTAVIDGVIHDTYDPQREGMRAVYGYYILK